MNIESGLTKTFPLLSLCFGDFKIKGGTFQGAPQLKEIHGCLTINAAKIRNISALKTAREGVSVKNSFVRTLGSLEKVEGPVEFERSQILNLFKLISVPDSFSVAICRMPHNLRLKEVGGEINVKGSLDAPNLRKAGKIITTYGILTISPALDAEVIRFGYKDYSVSEYLAFRRKRNTIKKTDDTPARGAFAQALVDLVRRLLGKE